MSLWCVIDVNNSCWRAHHSMGDLSNEDSPTGVVYGFLRDLCYLKQQFSCPHTPGFVFCFDYGTPFRKNRCPTYKSSRKAKIKKDPEAKKMRMQVARQIRQLREEILPKLGFTSLLWEEGFEADDVIASVCLNLPEKDSAIVVSTDKDLFQVLTKRVSLYRPIRPPVEVTLESFVKLHGVAPQMWAKVKALAGCSSDDIKGIKGVGEKTAIKFLYGNLPEHTKAYKRLDSDEALQTLWSNLVLTTLPYTGCPKFSVGEKDKISSKKWNQVVKSLQMKSLVNEW